MIIKRLQEGKEIVMKRLWKRNEIVMKMNEIIEIMKYIFHSTYYPSISFHSTGWMHLNDCAGKCQGVYDISGRD